jgi:hypothetical protein
MRSLFPIGAFVLAFVLACEPVQSHAQDARVGARVEPPTDVWIVSDRGGEIVQYLVVFTALERSGARVVIDGPCESACTLILAIIPPARLCVTARAKFGFHAAWRLDDDGRQIVSPAGTQFLLNTYPAPVRAWIVKNGGLKSRTLYLSGNGLAAINRQCMEPIDTHVIATNDAQSPHFKYALLPNP